MAHKETVYEDMKSKKWKGSLEKQTCDEFNAYVYFSILLRAYNLSPSKDTSSAQIVVK